MDFWFSSWEMVLLLVGFGIFYVMVKRVIREWLLKNKKNNLLK